MKTFMFVRNIKYRPSTYYRTIQYLHKADLKSIKISEFENNFFYEINKKKIYSKLNKSVNGMGIGYIRRISFLCNLLTQKEYKLYIQREVFPRFIDPLGKWLLKRSVLKAKEVIWDFDDNIIGAREITSFEKELLSEYASKIVAGNDYLKKTIENKYHQKVEVLNTTDKMMEQVNLKEINKYRLEKFNEELILIWVGTKINLQYLQSIIPELDEAAAQIDQRVTLKVVSNSLLSVTTDNLNIKNIEWSREIAFEEMLKSHIGLMPLFENNLTKGKCAFKAVQNIGCGLPVLVSDVGMNKEVIDGNGHLIKNKTQWINCLLEISNNKQGWLQKSQRSRAIWKEKFNSKTVERRILELL